MLKVVKNTKVRKATYSLRSEGETLLKTQFRTLAEQVAGTYFADVRSVSMIDNSTGKTVGRWNYGHRQEVRNR